MTSEEFRARMREARPSPATLETSMSPMEGIRERACITSPATSPITNSILACRRNWGAGEIGSKTSNHLFYVSTPASVAGLRSWKASRDVRNESQRGRLGTNHPGKAIRPRPENGAGVKRVVHKVFDEKDVFRIDHYLGKETVQNILVFRFGNSLFEPVWNRNYIDYVEITGAETVGVEGRASFYEETGALRDMVANHMLQLLALTAMEPPLAFEANEVREQKVTGLRSIRPMSVEEVAKRYRSRAVWSRRRLLASPSRVIVKSRE